MSTFFYVALYLCIKEFFVYIIFINIIYKENPKKQIKKQQIQNQKVRSKALSSVKSSSLSLGYEWGIVDSLIKVLAWCVISTVVRMHGAEKSLSEVTTRYKKRQIEIFFLNPTYKCSTKQKKTTPFQRFLDYARNDGMLRSVKSSSLSLS